MKLHRKVIKDWGIHAAAVLVGLVLVAGASQAQEDPIRVGVITDQVGSARFYAEPVTDGTRLCTAEINEQGGVLGRQIELIIEDDQNKPDVSAAKARKLVDDGVVAIISNSSSTATQQAQTVTLETQTPHITPANSSDRLTTAIENPYFFQLGPLGSTQIKTLMAYTRAQEFETAAIVSDNAALSEIIADVFNRSLEGAGVEIVANEVIPGGSTTALPQMQRVRAAEPDAIFQAGILGPQMVQFFQAYHQLGMEQPVLGSFNLSIPSYLTNAEGLMEGVAFIDAFDPTKAEAEQFISLYEEEHGETPFALPGYGCDGIRFVAHAIEQAGSTDKEAIRDAMANTENWVGVMGAKGTSYTCQESRRCFPPEGAVVRLIENNTHGPVVHSGTQVD